MTQAINNMKNKRLLFFVLLTILGVSLYVSVSHNSSCIKIPVFFTAKSFNPLIKSEIQGKAYSLLVDSGACDYLYLSRLTFEGIQKIDLGKTISTHDLRGNPYKWPIYSVPDVKIEPQESATYEIAEEGYEFHENTSLWNSKKRISKPDSHGRIGWQFFKNYCTLIDFPNSSIFMAKYLEDLENDGFIKIDNFISLPFTIEDGVLVVSIQTDLGESRVILDTGSTFCALKSGKVDPNLVTLLPHGGRYFPSSKLIIKGCDFGHWGFALGDFTDRLIADGLLGCDFFLEHAVCLDFQNKIAYIQKPGGLLATQWKRGKYYLTQFFLRNSSDFQKFEDL